jgi:UDP-glucose 6-dehydrogenase
MHDLSEASGASWDNIMEGMAADPRIGGSHLRVIDASAQPGAKAGRGAGGPCFIKDFAAFRAMYDSAMPDDVFGSRILQAMEQKNVQLLTESGKDQDLLQGVYGDDPMSICAS